MMPLLTFEQVSLSYPSKRGEPYVALKDLSVTAHRGEWIAVMGANGSGKSTLVRLVVGLLSPTHGRIRLRGEGRAPRSESPLGIGYLSQHPDHHVVGLTAWDDLRLSLEPLGLDADEVARRIQYWMSRVGMGYALHARTDSLSGGELQRIALAGVLAREPRLLVLDEPNAFADPQGARLVAEVTQQYLRSKGAACIWVTHSADEADLADRVLVLSKGQLVFDGTPESLWQRDDDLEAWGIGGPSSTLEKPQAYRSRGTGSGEAPGLTMMDVSFTYPGRRDNVLEGVRLTVRAGEAVALVGSSGAGKSTLLQIAAGLEHRTSGEMVVLGTRIPQPTGGWRGRREYSRALELVQPHIALAMQQPENQLFGATVWDDLIFGLRNLGIPPDEWQERVHEALSWVGLDTPILEQSPFTLSGGEKRKVALALGLVHRPRLFLLDEPTAGLDYPSRQRLARTIRDLAARGDTSVLFATHDRALVLAAASRTVSIDSGRVTEGELQRVSPPELAPYMSAEASDTVIPGTRGWQSIDGRSIVVGASFLALGVALVTHWVGLGVAAGVVLALLLAARMPWRPIAATFVGLLPFMVIAALFAAVDPTQDGAPLNVRLGSGLFLGFRMFLTVVSVVWIGHVLALSELMVAFGSILRPLERVGFPLGTVLTATLVAIRMVPTVAEEAKRIQRSQMLRGARRVRGWKGLGVRVTSLALPLSAAALRRAEQLGDALVVRGYLDATASSRKVLLRPRDVLVMIAAACLGAFILGVDRWGG